MSVHEEEVSITCPYCGEPISMLVDPASGSQTYVEDCEVCCRPIQLKYRVEDETITSVQALRLEA